VYEIALAVAACLRAGTRADVGWVVEVDGLTVTDWSRAVAFTPGGGRIGSIDAGPIDAALSDLAGRADTGRLVDVEVTETDALVAGLPSPGRARCLLVPADVMPPHLWDGAVARVSFCLVVEMAGDDVSELAVYTAADIEAANDDVRRLWAAGSSGSTLSEGRWVSIFRAVPQLVVVGDTPVAGALEAIAGVLGWTTRVVTDAASATGVIASLSKMDKVIVAAHDLELAGAALKAALDSPAGYIASMGSRRMQENRADWLAYRGVNDLGRIHGPAGLDIGASTPGEIAVAILAEAISVGRSGHPGTAT
jgi:xanthine dehydrogenase accessory factor